MLSATFAALADPTRRAILDRLAAEGEVSVSELAAPLPISLQAVSMHLKTLEQAGLVIRIRRGQQRPARLAGPATPRRNRLARPVPSLLGVELRRARRSPER